MIASLWNRKVKKLTSESSGFESMLQMGEEFAMNC